LSFLAAFSHIGGFILCESVYQLPVQFREMIG